MTIPQTGGYEPIYYHGLTKREHFAGLAMQALLSNAKPDTLGDPETVTKYSILIADELLKQLEKKSDD